MQSKMKADESCEPGSVKHIKSSNERLHHLVQGAGLTQLAALSLFNQAIKVRPLSESAWKGYFCAEKSARFRNFGPELLAHAEQIFGPLQKKW